jgi:uncharacterized FlgJ-related protein
MIQKFTTIDHNLNVRTRRDWSKVLVCSLLLNVILITYILIQEADVIHHYERVVVEKLVDDIPLTDSAIIDELTRQGCVLPNVALAQMKIETGHFSSKICKENKNIAGIKTSKSKYVTGVKNNHCVYLTYRDCIKDYIRIQDRYLKNIDGKYAEAKDYVNLIKQIK